MAKAKKRRVTPEDLKSFQYVSDPQIAPDGDRIVFVHKRIGGKNEYLSNLWMVTGDGEPRPFTSGDRDAHPRWSPDGDRVAFIGGRDKRRPQIYTIDPAGGEATALTAFAEGSIRDVRWSPDGTQLAVAYRAVDPEWTEEAENERRAQGLTDPPRVLDHWWYRLDGDGYFNAQRYELHVVDAVTGAHRRVYAKDTMGFFSFDWSPDGRELVIATNPDKRAGLRAWNDDLLRLNVRTGRAKKIPNLPKGPKDAVRWSPDGKWIAWAGREGDDSTYSTENLELWVADPAGRTVKNLTGREDYCLMAAHSTDTAEITFGPVFFWSPDSRRVFVQIGWHGESHLTTVAVRGGGLTFHTSGAAVYAPSSVSGDGRRVAMTVGSALKLDEICVAEFAKTKVATRTVTNLNGPALRELELSRPKSQWVTAPDGARVQVWTIPPVGAKAGRRVPAVLEIHGGPHAQYGVGYFHEFQVLAAAGYMVVYSNPRGSKGYGRDHCHAIRGNWGSADWTDIQAVTEFMKSHPSINAKRMGIMGGSYGGYMTNWAIGHTNDFAGAITDRCVSNLVSMAGNSDFLDTPDHYWEGNAWDRPEARWRSSPLQYLGRAKTPTLIIHSEGDLRCNVEQAEQVYSALTLRRVPTRFVRYARTTSHGMSRCGPPDMRVHRLHQVLEWWKKWL